MQTKIELPKGIQAVIDTSHTGIKKIEQQHKPWDRPKHAKDFLSDKVHLQGDEGNKDTDISDDLHSDSDTQSDED